MAGQLHLIRGNFNVGTATAAGNTAFRKLIPPWPGLLPGNIGEVARAVTKATAIRYKTGATAHLIGVMRPFNYCLADGAAAAAQAVVNLRTNPGLYSTAANWKYGTLPGTPRVPNNSPSSGDVVVYQMADGTWNMDTVASLSTLALTLSNSIPTGGIPDGGLIYFFGAIGDSDPNTGAVNPQWHTTANTDESFTDENGFATALHEGDPLVLYSPNTTDAGTLEYVCGFYAKS